MKRIFLLGLAGLLLAACNATPTTTTQPYGATGASSTAAAQAPNTGNIYQSKTGAKGNYMTDFNGMTLYTFDNDTNGVSNCTGQCLTIWPVYTSGATAQGSFPANISVITRSDGSKQFAWMGKPLYYYSGDKGAGDMNGDGVGGIWHIISL